MQDDKELKKEILQRLLLDNDNLDTAMEGVGKVDYEDLYETEQKEPETDIEMGRQQLMDYLRSTVDREVDRKKYYEKAMEPRRARARKLLGLE